MPELAPGDAGTSGVAAAAEVPSPNALPRSGAPERSENNNHEKEPKAKSRWCTLGACFSEGRQLFSAGCDTTPHACVDLTDTPDSDPDDVQ
ncbi:hypothetical protein HaLaN_26738, partial [Haematococcus lacustris]